MQTISYKVLFEVRILHDYYLMTNTGQSYYDLAPPAQQALLINKLRNRQYDILRDIDILVSPADRHLFENLRLKMVRSPTGFYVGAEVKPPVTADRKERYVMRINPPEKTTLTFGLATSGSLFSSITNIRIDRPAPLLYYFSNTGTHIDNALSTPVAGISGGTSYQMGDLAAVGRGIIQAMEDNTGDRTKWEPIAGAAFVHQADRKLSAEEGWYTDWRQSFKPVKPNPFAVVQITFNAGSTGMNLFDNDGFLVRNPPPQLEHPVFDLRFLSRATYWRYQKQDGFSPEELTRMNNHTGALLDFKNGKYITKKPYRLALNLPPLGAASFRLPNALPGIFKSENGRLVSDIYFNVNTPVP